MIICFGHWGNVGSAIQGSTGKQLPLGSVRQGSVGSILAVSFCTVIKNGDLTFIFFIYLNFIVLLPTSNPCSFNMSFIETFKSFTNGAISFKLPRSLSTSGFINTF